MFTLEKAWEPYLHDSWRIPPWRAIWRLDIAPQKLFSSIISGDIPFFLDYFA
jgi:hypothetical protein